MRAPPLRPHWPTVGGRLRAEPGLLALIGLVVAVATALTAAVAPLAERTADRAVAASVRDAGARGAVVATMPHETDDPTGQARDPRSVVEFRQDTEYAQYTMPARLRAVVSPAVASLTTPALHLLDGLGRYLRLAYVDTPHGPPAVTYTAGGPPQASAGADQADVSVPAGAGPWPVQVALSEAAAEALGLGPGDRLTAEDAQNRPVAIEVSGVFVATDAGDGAWQSSPELLHPVRGLTEGVERTSAAALVSPEALPDLRLAVPLDDLTHRVVFDPRPERLRWDSSSEVGQAVVSLKAAPGLARLRISWDSLLDLVLADARTQVAAARGQGQVLLLGVLACVLLVLVLAAQLLLRRRAGSVALARERGAALGQIGVELLVESFLVAVVGAVVGLLATWLLVGAADGGWTVPVLVVAVVTSPALGVRLAARSTETRRTPANRSVRRTADRARRLRRHLVEAVVVALAVLTTVALRQRGVTGGDEGRGDLTAAGAPVWWAVAGTLFVLRAFPPLARLLLDRARRTTGVVRLVVGARLAQVRGRLLPLLVVTVTVAQLTLGIALTTTERQGQEAGALLAVGGDARLTRAPDPSLAAAAREVATAPGVEVAVAARVRDGVPLSSRTDAASVELVVVDPAAYARLLAASPLPDAPDLARLPGGADPDGVVPALLLGGAPGLDDHPVLRWDELRVPLEVVGTAPRIGPSTDPVVVVDAEAFAATGAAADPDTVWAVGAGSGAALRAAAGPADDVELLGDVLDDRRDAPLAAGLGRLAVAFSALLLLLALVGLVLGAAVEAPARAESVGRLRSLGLGRRELRRVLAGELLGPVLLGAVAGLVLGVGCAVATSGSLSLQQVTGQAAAPELVVPWWTVLTLVVLTGAVLVGTLVESARLRRAPLADLLRGGDRR